MPELPDNALQRRWVHAHEEDTDEEMVFRPEEHELPPSRGRFSFELRPDGTYSESGPGATDRPEDAEGTWSLEQEDRLVLGPRSGERSGRVLRIAAAEPDRLVVRRD
jgi:hypothetical protein